jgi:H+-transporting ATPase
LSSSPQGLSADEAGRRLAQRGRNEIPEQQRLLLLELAEYFWGPVPWMIEVVAILSAVVHRFVAVLRRPLPSCLGRHR